MLDNRDLKRVFKKAEELKEFNTKNFGDLTVSELNHYFNKAEVLIDYIFCFKEGLEMEEQEQSTIQKGYYYAEYDENSVSYCVFHTDLNSGRAYSSYTSMQEAKRDAQDRNLNRNFNQTGV